MSIGPAVRRITTRVAVEDARGLPDAELLGRFAADRDEAAFTALVERHGPMVRGVCRRALGHAEDAEDAAQAVFLVLARNARKVRKHASVAAWLHGVAVRVCRKALARRVRRTARTEELPPDAVPVPPDADAVTWADARRVIDAALATLPASLREPLVLCYLQGLTRDEAADRLGCPVDTLRGRLERGRDRLRAALDRRGFALSAALVTVLISESPGPASPEWAAGITGLCLGHAPVPHPITTLAHGAVSPMKKWFLLAPAVALAGLLALGAASGLLSPDPPKATVPKPAERLLTPDPKAGPVADHFRGVWAAEVVAPNGDVRRDHELRFVDGSHLVWTVTQTSVGVRASTTLRCRYELKDDTLTLHVLERYAGEEKLPVRDDDKTRVYTFAWEGKGKTSFRIRNKTAEPDSPWATTIFTKAGEKPEPADPLVPEYLTKIDRTIRKEPMYAAKPLYLLLAFGPEARFKVWVVLDGTTLYVDRNGNGDLTDDGEKFDEPPKLVGEPGGPKTDRAFNHIVGDLTDAAGKTTHTQLLVSGIRLNTGMVVARVLVRVGGGALQMVGPTSLSLAESANDAKVTHFGGSVVTVRPSFTMASTPDANEPTDVRFQLGTPGVGGPAAFASFGCEHLGEEHSPVAEFEFTPLNPGEAPKVVKVVLTKRCCGDQFFAPLTVPDGVKTGIAAAKVTVTFPNCPWGKVEPATYPVDVGPKKK